MLPQQNEEKSAVRNFAEKKLKQQANKLGRKLAKKGAKLALKLLKKLAMKFIALLAKLLAWLASTVGLPVIGVGLLILVAVIIISLSWSYLMGTGEGLEGTDKTTYQYILAQANSTVNMKSNIERPYRVPEKLIAATIQLDAFQKNDDIKDLIKKMASSLAPEFDYGQYDEWTEKQVTVCEDGDCKVGDVQHTKNMVNKLNEVVYWNGSTTFSYTPKVTPWETNEKITYKEEKYTEIVSESNIEIVLIPYTVTNYVKTVDESGKVYIEKVTETKYREETKVVYKNIPVEKTKKIEVKTITKSRKQYYTSSQSSSTDYSTFDNVLNSYGLGLNDKKLIEINYLFMGGEIAYTDWLKTMGGGDLGFISFDGNIIPGGGVPPQFMSYYLSAEKKYGVNWYVLAAIHFVETGFSTHSTMISSVGAIGPMQFMPATWAGWKYNIGGGLVSSNTDLTSIAVIAVGNGYGRDGDGDSKADPWNVADSIHTAAYYLSKNGYSTDQRNAIYQYNHAEWYVNKVLSNSERFKNAATYEGGGEIPSLNPGSFMRPTTGTITSPFGYRDFRGGAMHFGIDIASGGKNVPIVASADGKVIRSSLTASYGNCVMVQHNIGGQLYVTVYSHMQNRAVGVGATVKQGQFLGYMGQTGDATGIHLHFEVHKGGYFSDRHNAINPALVVPF
jgi:murein DD-endopeptidase MepM/ murein hydrolase activator NlpD